MDRPAATTILAAAKLTGKIANNWSLGMINALASREYATVDSSGVRFKDEVEPYAYYGVLRAKREFRDGRQGVGMIATTVARDLRTPHLKNLLSHRAYTAGLDGWTFLDQKKKWVITGWVGTSRVEGDEEVIRRLQEAPARYYQRPDATHVQVDSSATSLSGWAARFLLNKQQGNLFVNSAIGIISPGFDTNDAGFHWRSDVINHKLVAAHSCSIPEAVLAIFLFTAISVNPSALVYFSTIALMPQACLRGASARIWSSNPTANYGSRSARASTSSRIQRNG